MKFIEIRDLRYITANNSHIDLFATCEEYGEIPMTINLDDIEDLHTIAYEEGKETKLKEHIKTLQIAPYVERPLEEIAEQELQTKIQEAKAYLASTDYKMTVDYFATLTEAEQVQLTQLRAEAREFIRTNEGDK